MIFKARNSVGVLECSTAVKERRRERERCGGRGGEVK